jgi:homospermidine synthase
MKKKMSKKIILIGGGSHANSCIDVINYNNDFEIEFIIDNKKKKKSMMFLERRNQFMLD